MRDHTWPQRLQFGLCGLISISWTSLSLCNLNQAFAALTSVRVTSQDPMTKVNTWSLRLHFGHHHLILVPITTFSLCSFNSVLVTSPGLRGLDPTSTASVRY
ncbi:hypothetical protein FCV25MIE_34550 [Fagus crenata]